jgi:hypothetical protein
MGNRASYSATAFRAAYPGATFDRARSDAYTFGASPGGSYTAWVLLTLTGHTTTQRLLGDADGGVNHHVGFISTEAIRIFQTVVASSAETGITTAMIRWSYNSTSGQVRISVNNAAETVVAATAGNAPAMDTLGASGAAPISMVLNELVIATDVYATGSTEATAMASYFSANAAAGLY